MNEIIRRIVSVLLVGGLIAGLIWWGKIYQSRRAQNQPAASIDFGDAPDNRPTNYLDFGAVMGRFPSFKTSGGLTAQDTAQIWLGDRVDQESDSKQTNADLNDDGVVLELTDCQPSKAYFMVHLGKPNSPAKTAYLNLFVDWNHDGEWAGSDDCAAEWTVKNFPIDLSAQQSDVVVYLPEFKAGKTNGTQASAFWYRATVSLNQLSDEHGSGNINAGEIEDYGPNPPLADQSNPELGSAEWLTKRNYIECPTTVVSAGQSRRLTLSKQFREALEWTDLEIVGYQYSDPSIRNNNSARVIDPHIIEYNAGAVSDKKSAIYDPVLIRTHYDQSSVKDSVCPIWIIN